METETPLEPLRFTPVAAEQPVPATPSRPTAATARPTSSWSGGLPSAASSSRHRRPAWTDERLPLLQDGRLSLELLTRYADEYDDHGEGATYPAATFVEYLRLEAKARLIRVLTGLVKHALAPKARERGGGRRLPVVTAEDGGFAPATGTPNGEARASEA